MALLSHSDQERLREAFAQMTIPVRLMFFTQTIGCETCVQTRQILDELPALSDKITIDEVNVILDPDRAKQYGVDRAPTIAVVGQEDTRIRFLGAPAGYEFISLVQAVLLAGGGESNLTEENRDRIAAVDAPIVMQVFTTPG
jgi:alkyl hydroperoxide reductase subunit AhpF